MLVWNPSLQNDILLAEFQPEIRPSVCVVNQGTLSFGPIQAIDPAICLRFTVRTAQCKKADAIKTSIGDLLLPDVTRPGEQTTGTKRMLLVRLRFRFEGPERLGNQVCHRSQHHAPLLA